MSNAIRRINAMTALAMATVPFTGDHIHAMPRWTGGYRRRGTGGVRLGEHHRIMCGKRQRMKKIARKSRAINRRNR